MDLYFDGQKCEQGGGIGIVFSTPQDVPILFSFKLSFECRNNNAKYEELILGLKPIKMKLEKLMIYGYSLLIVN